MRRSDREVTNLNEISDILRRCTVCHLGLSGAYPYVLPLSFGFCFEGAALTLYFHGAAEGKSSNGSGRLPARASRLKQTCVPV